MKQMNAINMRWARAATTGNTLAPLTIRELTLGVGQFDQCQLIAHNDCRPASQIIQGTQAVMTVSPEAGTWHSEQGLSLLRDAPAVLLSPAEALSANSLHPTMHVIAGVSDVCQVLESWAQCIGEGGFARVSEISHEHVLKATSCQPSIALLNQLYANKKPVAGLPVVHQVLGNVAEDVENMAYSGYVMERLRYAHTASELERHQEVASYFSQRLAELDHPETDWKGSVRLAREFAQTNIFGLGAAFAFLVSILQACQAVLDLAMPQNIMFTQHGNLCLADPVAPVFD